MTPIRLQEWFIENEPKSTMSFKKGYEHQCMFMRDDLAYLMSQNMPESEENKYPRIEAMVISTHRSKSIDLPVVMLEREDIGLKIILRDNFYNWKMSVISGKPVNADLEGLAYLNPPRDPNYTGDCLHPAYFEGFPDEYMFSYFLTSDRKELSMELRSDKYVYMAIFLILRSMDVITPLIQAVGEEYKAKTAQYAKLGHG